MSDYNPTKRGTVTSKETEDLNLKLVAMNHAVQLSERSIGINATIRYTEIVKIAEAFEKYLRGEK